MQDVNYVVKFKPAKRYRDFLLRQIVKVLMSLDWFCCLINYIFTVYIQMEA